jgi:aldehyde:ferredoxin oxidoreductase
MGQGHPAHDPRTLNGAGVTYATSPMGADHTAGLPFSPNKKKAIALSKESQITSMLCDVLGLCIFVFATVDALAEIYGAFCDREVSPEEMRSWALSLLRAEVAFNERAGVASIEERTAKLFREEPLPETGNIFDTSVDEMAGIFDG